MKKTARASAIDNLMKFLHKSEAGRFAPKAEPKPAEPQEQPMDADMLQALQSIANSGE